MLGKSRLGDGQAPAVSNIIGTAQAGSKLGGMADSAFICQLDDHTLGDQLPLDPRSNPNRY